MSYQALARKWRPQTFRDIIGQETVVRTLQNAIEQERIHHAYLFSGVRGVGKTTAARILAKAVNCVKGPTAEPCNECTVCREITEGIDLDVREIDAATYTQVDNIRDLREVTQFQPARDRKRIFIIDEAHMLSSGAWNALLKLIEEPPPHVLFIMATTEVQKVPATILSRVQRFVFNKITYLDVQRRLTEIIEQEGMQAEPAALEIVARRGEGSVRDSLSLLDQVIAFGGRQITAADVATILGLSETHFFARLAEQIRHGDNGAILQTLEEAAESGRDFKLLYRDFLTFLRNLLLIRSGAPESMLAVATDERAMLEETAAQFEASEILRVMNLLIRDDETVTKSEQQRLAVEITLLKAATLPRLLAVESVLQGNSIAPSVQTAPKVAPKPPRSSEVPAPKPDEDTNDAPPSGLREQILNKIRSQRKHSTASYLDMGKGWSLQGDTLLVEFEPDRKFALDHLSDEAQVRFLDEVASELRGTPTKFKLAGRSDTEPPAQPGSAALQQDPILKAFAKHLGGEVVPQKRKKQERP